MTNGSNFDRDDKAREEDINEILRTAHGWSGGYTVELEDCDRIVREIRETPKFIRMGASVIDEALRRFESEIVIPIGKPIAVKATECKPWLQGSEISDWYYWDRYEKYLANSKNWAPKIVRSLAVQTDEILDLCGNPNEPGLDRRGMVIGYVQSGKTANYLGLISKAADSGYKIIVVIAGLQNRLRNQTQVRLEEGFVGVDSSILPTDPKRFVGVGKISSKRVPFTFTNRFQDFGNRMTGMTFSAKNLKEPIVFVVKKNPKTLTNLLTWFKGNFAMGGSGQIDSPILVIDDEADNASVNVKYSKEEVSKINGQIRELLEAFSRSSYIGYTATPFANIFIDPDIKDENFDEDLFPRSFIFSMTAPETYVGAQEIFCDNPKKYLRDICDSDSWLKQKHKSSDTITGLPESLKRAIRLYILAGAIKHARKKSAEHHSMLINVSPYNIVQESVEDAVVEYLRDIQSSCSEYGGLPWSVAANDEILSALYEDFSNEYSSLGFGWEQVRPFLSRVSTLAKVLLINGRSGTSLDYENYDNGRYVIAVGGYALSRGLTLEGLTISYYLRNSRMYDTLMQMGRWFGYRPGYRDLCRIFMRRETQGYFEHVANSDEELRLVLRQMSQSKANPNNFGLYVHEHPESLEITAYNKRGNFAKFKQRVSFDSQYIETYKVIRDAETLVANKILSEDFANQLAGELSMRSTPHAGAFAQNCPAGAVLDYIAKYKIDNLWVYSKETVIDYIESCNKGGELLLWDVYIPSVNRPNPKIVNIKNVTISCPSRSAGGDTDSDTIYIGDKARRRFSSRGIEQVGLDNAEIRQLNEEFHKESPSKSIPGSWYRSHQTRPLLVLHFLEITGDEYANMDPVAAWSISFPPTGLEHPSVEVRGNKRYIEALNATFDDLADDEDGDYGE